MTEVETGEVGTGEVETGEVETGEVETGEVGGCDSCGVEGEALAPVRRKYLAAPDGTRAERVADEIERWCVPCLTNYPHEPTG